MKLPDFIIGGAPRSGTTFLYHLLDSHPEISMAKPANPEPKFFLVNELYKKGLEYYSRNWFDGFKEEKILGEKSTNYLENPYVAKRISTSLPYVKLLFILRNPIQRAYSNYKWSKQNGLEILSFKEALEKERSRERRYENQYRYSRPFSYISRGFYANFLRRYYDLFKRENISVCLFDEIEESPQKIANQIFSFLNVKPYTTDFNYYQKINQTSIIDESLETDVYEFLRGIYFYPNLELEEMINRDLSKWNQPLEIQ